MENRKERENRHYMFFQNKECEMFPCHAGVPEEAFNCLFCYCPLYALGDGCGGNFRYTENGVKDCSRCLLPHSEKGYEYILKKFPELARLAARNREGRKS